MSERPTGAATGTDPAPAPDPAPDPAVLAMIAVAVDAVWPRSRAVPSDDADPAHRAWRFSGRWWNQPTALRRERPRIG